MTELFHYTSAAALCGVIQNSQFWATEYRFLNDASEFRYGCHLLTEALNRAKAANVPGITNEVFQRVEVLFAYYLEPAPDRNGHNIFIVSLTSERDLLSQWRGYNGGSGFSIGMDSEWLEALAEPQGFVLRKVVYDERKQIIAVDRLFRDLGKRVKGKTLSVADVYNVVGKWWIEAVTMLALLKDDSFKEEQEVRLVKITSTWPAGLKFRQGVLGIVPYVAFNLEKKARFTTNNLGFSRILIGPALNDRQRIAVDALLASKHMRFEIERSAIPYVAV